MITRCHFRVNGNSVLYYYSYQSDFWIPTPDRGRGHAFVGMTNHWRSQMYITAVKDGGLSHYAKTMAPVINIISKQVI
jgi:hypothetical protein